MLKRRYFELLNELVLGKSFSPLSISSTYIWFAADKETAYADGAAVDTVTDFSGNARNATAAGTAKPLYITSGINGKPVYRLDGNDDVISLVNLSALTAAEVFVVAQHTGSIASASGSLWEISGSTYLPYTDGAGYDSFGTTARVDGMALAGAMESPFIYNVSAAAGLITNRLNGAVLSNRASNVVSFFAAPKIGTNSAGQGKFDISEFYLSSSVLSAIDRASFKAYFSSKYAITVS